MKYSKSTTYDPNLPPNSVHNGISSWLNLLVVECKEDLEGLDVVVSGAPWEGDCTIGGYSSITEGPEGIRSISIHYTSLLSNFNFDFFDYLEVADFGDVACQDGNYDSTFRQIRERTATILDIGAVLLTFGGDYGIAFLIISETTKHHPKRVGTLHFDAHLDNYACFGDDLYSYCSSFYRPYEDPDMDPSKIVHIGVYGLKNHQEEFNNTQELGTSVILDKEVKENDWGTSTDKVVELVFKGMDSVYVTIYSDAPDVAGMPQEPQDMGGLTSYELRMMVYETGLAGTKGFDSMEIYPDTNSLQTAAYNTCWAALYYPNSYAERKRNGGKQVIEVRP